MAETTEVHKEITYDDGRTEHMVATPANGDRGVARAQSFVQLLYAILAALLIIRTVLSLLAANTSNAFASFIYNVTNPFVAPFRGLLGYDLNLGKSRFELETLIALVVYGLIAYIIIRLLGLAKHNPDV